MEENLRVINFRELLNILKRIWAFILAAFILGWAVTVLVKFFDKKDYFEAVRTIEIRLNFSNLISGEEQLTDSIIETKYNYVTACFDNKESKILTVQAIANPKITERDLIENLSVSRSRSILTIAYFNQSKPLATQVINKFVEVSEAKAASGDISFSYISSTVEPVTFKLSSIIMPSVAIGIGAGIAVYAVYFLIYLLGLSTRAVVERALDLDINGVLPDNGKNEHLYLNELYVNIKNKFSEKTIVLTDAGKGTCDGILKLAKCFSINSKKTIIVDCNYSGSGCFSDKFEGDGAISATADNYRKLLKQIEGIDIISSNGINHDNAGFVSAPGFAELIKVLEKDYDAVLIYSAPLDVYSDALILAGLDNAALLINVDIKSAKRAELTGIRERLKEKKAIILGAMVVGAKEYFYKTV